MTNEGDSKLQAALNFISEAQRKKRMAGQAVRPQPKPSGEVRRAMQTDVPQQLKQILGDIVLSEGQTWVAEMEYQSLSPAKREPVEEPLPNFAKIDSVRQGTVATYRPHEIIAALTEDLVAVETTPENADKIARFAHGFHFHPWKVRRSA